MHRNALAVQLADSRMPPRLAQPRPSAHQHGHATVNRKNGYSLQSLETNPPARLAQNGALLQPGYLSRATLRRESDKPQPRGRRRVVALPAGVDENQTGRRPPLAIQH